MNKNNHLNILFAVNKQLQLHICFCINTDN